MLLSVVIPAYNEEKLLSATLTGVHASLAAVGLPRDGYEIIVCDNASTDRTAEIAVSGGARVVHEPVRQIARARNAGAAAAQSTWLLFLDADSIPSAGLLGEMVSCFDRPIAGGGSTLRMENLPLWPRAVLGLWNGVSRGCRWMAGSFIFCRSETFQVLGGFSVELFAAEELDFSRRLKKWAKQNAQKLVILSRNPLVTSARKLELYSVGDILRMVGRIVRNPAASLRDPEACSLWYDGRR